MNRGPAIARFALLSAAFILYFAGATPARFAASEQAGIQAQSVQWPLYGPDRKLPAFQGFTNSLPDLVGPIDGSARLTIFTEGNHYPILLPLLFEEFPAWCAKTGRCKVRAEDILAVTLPQVMIVAALKQGGLRFGNAVLPVGPDQNVFPQIVMGGAGPLRKLAAEKLISPRATVFARHRGLGLLMRREIVEAFYHARKSPAGSPAAKSMLRSFASGNNTSRLIIATPFEAGARRQYERTLASLLGAADAETLLARDIGDFPGRLRIQHRDVPYALLNRRADVGVIFGHLAEFYANRYPQELAYVAVPEAAPFGQEIALAETIEGRSEINSQSAPAFREFFLERARTIYPARGFSATNDFSFGRTLDLRESVRRF